MTSALRDAFLSAAVALGLFLPLVGLRTQEAGQALTLTWRPVPVAILVAAVFLGRLAWRCTPKRRIRRTIRLPTLLLGRRRPLARYAAPALLVAAIIWPLLPGVDRYQLDLGVLILTYVMLGWGLNVVVGLAGLLDLGYVAFYAVGAYSFALIAQTTGLGFWPCLPVAGLLAAFCGLLLGFPVLRLRGDYLAIVTLAFGEIIRVVLINWVSLTGGPNGLSGMPRPTLFGLTFPIGAPPGSFAHAVGLPPNPLYRFQFLYYVILALALLTAAVVNRLRRLPIGRAWEALREDEIACRSLGIDTTITRLTAFAIGAGVGGLAGALFATRQGFISPESFTFQESALVLAIVVLGGMGSQFGVALAAIVMIGGFELSRDFAEFRMVVFGGALVVIMVLRPRGLASGRTPTVTLGSAARIDPSLVAQGRG
jgi:branched-chain amino acid transport system permease protein